MCTVQVEQCTCVQSRWSSVHVYSPGGAVYTCTVQVEHSSTVGRYLVAARDIQPLELVLWDK